jgi:hypothetical protein
MTSQKQIRANRRNAQRSSGPKTTQGRSISRMNALKHGLLAEQVVIPGEDFEELDTLRRNLDAEFEPQGALEASLVERIVMSLWRMRRCYGSGSTSSRKCSKLSLCDSFSSPPS